MEGHVAPVLPASACGVPRRLVDVVSFNLLRFFQPTMRWSARRETGDGVKHCGQQLW